MSGSESLIKFADTYGIYGSVLHYGLVIAFVGSAFMIFAYLWYNKRLDMDEGPKIQMLKEDSDGQ